MRAILFFLLLGAVPAYAADIVLELKREALLRQPSMTVEDVADVAAADGQLRRAVQALPLGRAPLAGYQEQRSRSELEAQIMGQAVLAGHRLQWQGATAVRIRSAAEMVEGTRLVEAAKAHVQAEFGARYAQLALDAASAQVDLAVPAGEFQLRARKIGGQWLASRVPVWVDVIVNGAVYRSAVVPLQVVAGERVAVNGVTRGDRVRLLVAGRGLTLEVPAVAQADAVVGQDVMVKPGNGNGMLAAKVMGPGQVRIDER